METEDEGELIFDFTKQENNVSDLFATLTTKGEVNGNKPYENILTLITPNNEESSNGSVKDEVKINSNNVIVSYNNTEKKGKWEFASVLEEKGFHFYNGTNKKEPITSFDDIRVLHYESCRGLEAWSVCCFDLDSFYNNRFYSEDTKTYLLEQLFDDFGNALDSEKRQKMYATNWLLMVLTRAMDTLYIQINKPHSYLGLLIAEYVKLNKDKKNIKLIS